MTTTMKGEGKGFGQVRYPDVSVGLVGQDGNVFNLLGLTRRAMRAGGVPAVEVEAFMSAATSCGSYDEVLALIGRTVEVF